MAPATTRYGERLEQLAAEKAAEYASQSRLLSVAIIGSVARGMMDQGSDVDLWAFSADDEEGFEDGVQEGTYWEIDIKPSAWLSISVDHSSWLNPPAMHGDEIGLLEALWGSRIVKDVDGRLTKVKRIADACVADKEWLRRRAGLFLAYGRGALDALRMAPPLERIVASRLIATNYGVSAYWMRQGQLLTGAARVPEKLARAAPELHASFCRLFGLAGKESWEQFRKDFSTLPNDIQTEESRNLEIELQPAADFGLYDGALRFMRQGSPDWYGAERVRPILALESDLPAQAERLHQETETFLQFCGGLG